MGREIKDYLVHCGREITAVELADIQETVDTCSGLSRSELALTISEHLEWHSASGSLKQDACLKLLEKLEAQGFLSLPAKQLSSARVRRAIPLTERTAAGAPLEGIIGDLGSVQVIPITDSAEIGLWNEYVSRYHYLGYQRPFGCSLRYFIVSDRGRLGCLLFSGAAKALRERDQWLGWTPNERRRNLGFVVNNSRFLVFPWVRVKNLASHALGQVVRRLGDDWQQRWGYRPVVVETFVDPEYYAGTCYRAANWLSLGQTTGTGLPRKGKSYTSSPKQIWVLPLVADFRTDLRSLEVTL
jgi:hypothetical protein